MRSKIDPNLYINKKYHNLKILSYLGQDEEGYKLCEIQCDCGNLKKVKICNILRGKTKSCGCLQKTHAKIGYGEAAFNELYRSYKFHAIQRNYTFEINRELFKLLTKQNCHYCGKTPSSEVKYKKNNGTYIYNGIDRKNNKKGYIIDNIITCCETCNRMKLKSNYEEFKENIKNIYNYWILNEK